MNHEVDREKIKQILTDTIVSLCKNGISFNTELKVEALIGLTLDCSEVFLVNIKETVALHEFVTPTPVIEDNYSRSVTSSTVAKKRPQPQHEKMTASQYQQAETQSMAVQPFFDRGSNSGFDNRKQAKSTASSKISEWQTSAHHLKLDPDEIRSSPSTHRSMHVKHEPTSEHSGYDESSSEVYYGANNYDANEQESYQYDTSGEGYFDQQYVDNTTNEDQYSSDMFRQESVPFTDNKKPPAKRRKVQNPSTGHNHHHKSMSSASSEVGAATSRPSQSPAGRGKDSNNSGLIERALNLVHEGQLTAGVAIKLFGIPKSTFYKKLSMSNPRQQQQQQNQDIEDNSAFPVDETYGEYFDAEGSEWSSVF